MKEAEFWKKAEARTRENKMISQGGLPNAWAGVMEWVGLKFWMVGLLISLGISVLLWTHSYALIVQVVRVIIWR